MVIVKINPSRGDYSDPDYVGTFPNAGAAQAWINDWSANDRELKSLCDIITLQSPTEFPSP